MTFTTNHDHEDQRWMHAHERRTLHAYHACLTDFYIHFSCYIISSNCDSSGDTGLLFGIFSSRLPSTKGRTFRYHHHLSASSARPAQSGRANWRSSTTEYTTQRSLPDFSKGVFSCLFIHPATSFWHLPFRGNIPPWPDLYLLFLLFTFSS